MAGISQPRMEKDEGCTVRQDVQSLRFPSLPPPYLAWCLQILYFNYLSARKTLVYCNVDNNVIYVLRHEIIV